jgi:hypothetical protein
MMKSLITLGNLESTLRLDAGASSLAADTSIVIRSGDQSVTITKAGDIIIKSGTNVKIEATSVSVTGAEEVTVKSDTMVKINAPVVEVTGETMIKLNS